MSRVRNGAIDATMTLPGVARRPGRPVTGKAKTAAERMRAYRQRRLEQANEFPSRVTKTLPVFDDLVQVAKVTKKRVTQMKPTTEELLRQSLVDNVSMYAFHRNGNPYQRHCAFFEFFRIQEVLFKLGGMAGVW